MALIPGRLPIWAYAAALGGGLAAARFAGGGGSGPATPATPASSPPPASGAAAIAGGASDVWGSFGGSAGFFAPSQGIGLLNGVGVQAPTTSDGMTGNGTGGSIGSAPPPPAPAPPTPPPTSSSVAPGTSWMYQAQLVGSTGLYRQTYVAGVSSCPLVAALHASSGYVNVNKRSICGSTWWWIVGGPYGGYAIRVGDANARISVNPIGRT